MKIPATNSDRLRPAVKNIIFVILGVSLVINFSLAYFFKDNIRNSLYALTVKNTKKETVQPSSSNQEKKFILPNYQTPFNDQPVVYYIFSDQVTELEGETQVTESVNVLPPQLMIQPGLYLYEGRVYNLTKDGLYRFINPGKENQQRIVFSHNLDALISSISWITTHGNADDGLASKDLSVKATRSKLVLTCGPVSNWAMNILSGQGFTSRIVAGLTLDQWNTYNNGHTLLEVYKNDLHKWVVYDLDNNRYFVKNNIPLSFMEFYESIPGDDYEIERISGSIRADPVGFVKENTSYNYALIWELFTGDEKSLRKWYRRVIQVPMISQDDKLYFYDTANKDRVQSYASSYKYISPEQFFQLFY